MSHVLTPGGTLDTVQDGGADYETIYAYSGRGHHDRHVGEFAGYTNVRMQFVGVSEGASFEIAADRGFNVDGTMFRPNVNPQKFTASQSNNSWNGFGLKVDFNLIIHANWGGGHGAGTQWAGTIMMCGPTDRWTVIGKIRWTGEFWVQQVHDKWHAWSIEAAKFKK